MEFMELVKQELQGMPEEDKAELLALAQEINDYEDGLKEEKEG